MCLVKQVDAFLGFFRLDQSFKMWFNCLNLLKLDKIECNVSG
jgi:hypothetical protein